MIAMGDQRSLVATNAEIARELCVTVRQIGNYLVSGMPREPGGGYCVEDCRAWVAANINRSRRKDGDDGEQSPTARKLEADARKASEDARTKRLKRLLLQGRVMLRDVVLRCVSEIILRARTRIEAMVDELLLLVPPELRTEIGEAWRERIRLLFVELAAMEVGGGMTAQDCIDEAGES